MQRKSEKTKPGEPDPAAGVLIAEAFSVFLTQYLTESVRLPFALIYLDVAELSARAMPEVGTRMIQWLGEAAGVVARIGGDQFIAFLGGSFKDEEIMTAASRLQEWMTQPISLEGTDMRVNCSIGIATFEDDMLVDATAAIGCAKIAAMHARQSGSGNIVRFQSEMASPEAGLLSGEPLPEPHHRRQQR